MAHAHTTIRQVLTAAMLAVAWGTLGWATLNWRILVEPLNAKPAFGPYMSVLQLHSTLVPLMFPATWAAIAASVAAPALLGVLLFGRSQNNRAIGHLCVATAVLAAVLAYWGFVLPLRLLAHPGLSLLADIASGFAFAWVLRELIEFSSEFPRPVDLMAIAQWNETRRAVRDSPYVPSWMTRFRRWAAKADRFSDWRKSSMPRFVGFLRSARGFWILGAVMGAGVGIAHVGAERTGLKDLSVFGMIVMMYPAVFYVAWIAMPLHWTLQTGTEEEKQKVFWICWGGVVAFWLPGVTMWAGFIGALFGLDTLEWVNASVGLAWPAAVVCLMVALAVAIFFQGALDSRLAITRTSVIGILGIVLPPVVLTAEKLLEHTIIHRLHLPEHTVVWASIGLTAVFFKPISHRMEHWLGGKLESFLPASALAGAQRVQAVIGFVDLSGYTALMARDEKAALTHAAALHKAGKSAGGHGRDGRMVKTLGDAVLWESPDARGALATCRAMQSHYLAEVAREGQDPLPLHFGLHAGEVVRAKDGDVFGSVVNVAARLLGQAGGGEIVLSAEVAGGLAGEAVALQPMGARQLKNVPEPVMCFRTSTAG